MKTATVRDLRNDFAKLSKWLARGETIEIIKRGKPFATVTPNAKSRSFLGAGKGTVKIPDDIDEPLAIEWEAMK